MREQDLSKVNLVQSKAFTHARIKTGQTTNHVPLCRPGFLKMYFEGNRNGSFVVEEKGRINGYCFSRLWGKVGWIGPLAVLPEMQRQGLGKQLLRANIACLKSQGASVIGLELEAASSNNLGFYAKYGFQVQSMPVDLMIDATKLNSCPSDDCKVEFLSQSSKKSMLKKQLARLSSKLCPGLDYHSEFDLVAANNFGDTMVIKLNEEVIAFALAHTESYAEDERRQFLKINLMQADPDIGLTILPTILKHCSLWAESLSLPYLYIRVPAECAVAFEKLLRYGFKVLRNDIRMCLKGFSLKPGRPELDFSKWL